MSVDVVTSRVPPGLELRVHGMGDHKALSALGSATTITSRYPRGPDTEEAPPIPKHELQLLNWSRTSRRTAGTAIWFSALPFSFVNVAGYTALRGGNGFRGPVNLFLRFAVFITGLLLTASALFWLVLIGESVLNYVAVGDHPNADSWMIAGLTFLLSGVLIGRHLFLRHHVRTRGESPHLAATLLHTFVSLLFGSLLIWNPPTQWHLPASWPTRLGVVAVPRPLDGEKPYTAMEFCSAYEKDPTFTGLFLDPVNAFILGTLLVAIAFGVVLALIGLLRRRGTGPSRKASLAVAAMCLTAGVGLMHALGGAVRLAALWLMAYLDGFAFLNRFVDRSRALSGYDYHLRITDTGCVQPAGEWLPNTLAGFALLAIIVLALAVVVVNLFRGGARWPECNTRKGLWEYIHKLVVAIPRRLPAAFLIAVIVWALLIVWAIWKRAHGTDASVIVTVIIAQAGAAVGVALLFFNGKVRRFGSVAADIIGFWPVTWHPLAGRSYRPAVVEGLSEEISAAAEQGRRLVLIGHSQGSVISVWTLANRKGSAGEVAFITCGSPLQSLYEMFFPAYVNATLYEVARARTTSWTNYWRLTDPIGTNFERVDIESIPLLDPPESPEGLAPRAHNDYWIDETVMANVTRLLNSAS